MINEISTECSINDIKQISPEKSHIINLSEILDKYRLFKENFAEKENFYLNYFYFFIKEHYESIINNVNFFHFVTEALLLEVLPILKTNDNSIQQLKSIKINKKSFYENFKILTGSCYDYDVSVNISEKNLALGFLKNFNIYKNKLEIFISETESLSDVILTCCKFAASKTLFNFNLVQIKDDEKFFYKCIKELKSSHKNVIFQNYLKLIETKLNLSTDIVKDPNVLNCIKIYYFYSKTTYEDYLNDLELFNDHSHSLFQKVKKISLNNYNKLNLQVRNIKKSTYEKLKIFYNQIGNRIISNNVLTKFTIYKNWINQSIFSCPNYFYDKYQFSKIFVYNKVVCPSKDLIILYTDRYVSFLITNFETKRKSLVEFTKLFYEKAEVMMTNLENKINEKELCIRFTVDEKIKFMKIDMDRSTLVINSKNFKDYAENVYAQMIQNSCEIYSKSKEFLINNYKRFLKEEELIIN